MKQQIIKKFLEEGVLLSPEALEKVTEENAGQLLEEAISSKDVVFSLQKGRRETTTPVIEVRKLQKKTKLSPQDFAKHYNARFEGIRGMLLKKMETAVSVANAKRSGSQAATIGMVREQTQRGFTIEDTTGSAEVISKAEDVAPDDVIGVKGGVKEERLFAEEIIWPDVPMSNRRSSLDMKILLTDKDGHKVEEGTTVITPEAVYGFDKKRISLPNPGWITISRGEASATILVYRPAKPVTQKEAFAWLKKRHLSPTKEQIRGTDDPFVIEPIPSLVWVVQADNWKESYKGVIVVSSDGKEAVKVELATGEVKFS